VIDDDALSIIEGALQDASMQVRDNMIPKSQTITVPAVLTENDTRELISKAAHSIVPVSGDNVDNVIGILLAKDL